MVSPDILILREPLDPEAEARCLRARAVGAGAIVTFTGVVRDDGGGALRLVLEQCPGLTANEIERFAGGVCRRWPLLALVIRHRVGEIGVAEPIVFVGAASAHRRAAFEAADCVMDYLKSAAPFWKREVTDCGSRWIEPKAGDYRDLDRWVSNS